MNENAKTLLLDAAKRCGQTASWHLDQAAEYARMAEEAMSRAKEAQQQAADYRSAAADTVDHVAWNLAVACAGRAVRDVAEG